MLRLKKPIVILAASCLMACLLSGCGGTGGRVSTDHDMPLTDTTMGETDANLAPNYNEIDVDPIATPSPTPDGSDDDVEIPDLPGDGEDDADTTDLPPESSEQVPAGNTPDSTDTQPVMEITLQIPPDADVTAELTALSMDAPVIQNLGNTGTVPAGTIVASNEYATIDYSNANSGYIVVTYTASTSARIKCLVAGPSTTYNYNLTPGVPATLPMSDGNGNYKVTVYQNVSGTKYASVLSQDMTVNLTDAFVPFLNSNQYVDFAAAPNTVLQAAKLAKDQGDVLNKVAVMYDWVVQNIVYDTDKAQTVESGYLPVLDNVLLTKKGICFDYAALMAGMLRSQNIPCKLVVGYAGNAYHAWISVWVDDVGWVEGFIYFDGVTWQRMDPTFDANGQSSAAIREFIGNGSNYTVKYLY